MKQEPIKKPNIKTILLTKLRASVVCEGSLAKLARQLNFGDSYYFSTADLMYSMASPTVFKFSASSLDLNWLQ